jgi:hypothetical protein
MEQHCAGVAQSPTDLDRVHPEARKRSTGSQQGYEIQL